MNTLREDDTGAQQDAAVLRAALVTKMITEGDLRTDEVIRAFTTVPREAFAPDAPLSQVYGREDVVVTKRDESGSATSSVSAPWIQAQMLEQAGIRAGMRVLEIGSGGYNAALIAELVGAEGAVTTVDIDPFVVDRARQYLAATGYSQVNVLQVDAEGGVPAYAPFDRIIVTAGAWDIPPTWTEQLSEDGVLVVPLRLRGLSRSFAFAREKQGLVSRGYTLCGFVPMQGTGANDERMVVLEGEEVGLRIDGDPVIDVESLRAALKAPRLELSSGVEVGGFEAFDDLDLFLATRLDDFGLLVAKPSSIESGLVEKSTRLGAKTAIAGGSFAYRAPRATTDDRTSFELMVIAHGRDAEAIGAEYVALIREWDRAHRHGPGARVEVFPAGSPDAEIGDGRLVEKKHTRVLISWPS